jgi:hypothetical protein
MMNVTSSVLVNLTPKPGITADRLKSLLVQEQLDTVDIYLKGKVLQWWTKTDGSGVLFLLNVSSVDEARALMCPLPLMQAGIAGLEFIPLGPLQALGDLARLVRAHISES